MTLKHAFPPVASPDARVLVLGSLPGDASLAAAQYYAHPANAFWRMMDAVTGAAMAALPYAERLERLRAHRIALWDVIASAHRPGSLDGAIRGASARDLAGFAATLPDLRAIAFNGGTAARHGRRQLVGVLRIDLIDLPSTSAAFAGMPVAEKRARWVRLRDYL
jgi:double-stranded uracil-DNA glycosylase